MQKDLDYLYSLRKYILVVTGVFILSLIAGLVASQKNFGFSENYFETLQNSYGWIKELNPFLIMLLIFFNNAIKSLLALLLGVGLGVIPLLFVAVNGVVLSIVVDVVSKKQGILFVAAALLPHGIIEIPIVLISAGIGLRLGYVMYLSIRGLRTDIKQELKQGLIFYIIRIVPLLFVAAMVETFITPLVASMFITS
ncbi:MAG: stage II sporulation protein M [Candidatus Methanoperedens sp.]|nr:stage II sporulation protein M [Candidatus Methanoperedens sp.]